MCGVFAAVGRLLKAATHKLVGSLKMTQKAIDYYIDDRQNDDTTI